VYDPVDETNPLINYNPANSFLKIQLRFLTKTLVYSALYDMQGRKIMNLFNDDTKYQELHYYLSWLKPGIYLVSIQYANVRYSKKLLIK
jgi:hypothetical protein